MVGVLTCIEGRDLAKGFHCPFMETSAKKRTNVDETFFALVREIRKFNNEGQSLNGDGTGAKGSGSDSNSGGCCMIL